MCKCVLGWELINQKMFSFSVGFISSLHVFFCFRTFQKMCLLPSIPTIRRFRKRCMKQMTRSMLIMHCNERSLSIEQLQTVMDHTL